MTFRRKTTTVLAIASVLLATAAIAQTPAPDRPALQLGLGDFMTALVQPRHAKLGLGGQARNWDYVAYERGELTETFELIEHQVPRYRGTAMSDLLQMLKPPMAALDKAIKAKDGAGFDAAYGQLTDACNACHLTTEHRMVVIQVPKASAFPNQDFAPKQ
jgi:hypothetical protein